MWNIYRKNGWVLNPNDKVVNGILKGLERNNGECPCHNNSFDRHCPCTNYTERDICCCGLYLKVDNKAIIND